MNTTIELLNHKITLALGVIALVGVALGFMDSRHASASGVDDLTQSILDERIERIEYLIEENERRIKRLKRTPSADRTQFDKEDMEDYQLNNERFLRTLERLQSK